MIALLVIKIMLAVTLLVTAVDSADTTWNQPLEFKSRHLSLEDCQMSQQYKQNSVCISTGELYGIR